MFAGVGATVRRLLSVCIIVATAFVCFYTFVSTDRRSDVLLTSVIDAPTIGDDQPPAQDLRYASYSALHSLDSDLPDLHALLESLASIAQIYDRLVLVDAAVLRCIDNVSDCRANELVDMQSVQYAVASAHWSGMLAKIPHWPVAMQSQNDTVVQVQFNGLVANIVRLDVYEDYVVLNAEPPRAFLWYSIQNASIILDKHVYAVRVPDNIDYYLWQYNRSQLIHCREDLAASLRLQHPEWQISRQLPVEKVVPEMKGFRDILHKLRVTPLLFGGTALGWYRECSIIPYTTDTDFATFIEEYTDQLVHKFKWHRKYALSTIYGLVNDSLEMSVVVNTRKIDLFFLSPDAQGSWVGGMKPSTHEKLRWTYRKRMQPWLRDDDVCTGVLHEALFMVPCMVSSFLEDDYGPEWHLPHHDRTYVWYASHHNVHKNGKWPDDIWKQVYRIF